MRMPIISILMLALLALISCNKTPMKGEYERFVGIWRWQQTSWTLTGGPPIYVTEADSLSYLYTIEITKQGEMFWYKDGEQLQKFNLKVENAKAGCSDGPGCNCYIGMKHPTVFAGFSYSCSSGYEKLKFPDSRFPYDAPGVPENNWFIRME